MRDKSILPHLNERRNSNRKSPLPLKVLDSIPETEDASPSEDNIPNAGVKVHLKERDQEGFQHNEAAKWRNLPTGINLPKLDNTFSTAPGFNRENRSLNSSSFLNIANMSLSPRAHNDNSIREKEIKCGNYLLFEPIVSDQVSVGNHLSRYSFRSSLERIPETDGERLLSARSKTKSNNAAEKMKQDSTKKEKNKQVRSVKSVDLFDQQRQQLTRKGPQIRVWFSYKQRGNRLGTLNNLTNRLVHDSPGKSRQVELNEELRFPRIILYQWEVHEKKPKFIKVPRSLQQQKKLPKLHRIPTASQEDQPSEDSNKVDLQDHYVRRDSPLPKLPQAPPPTPLYQRSPSGSSRNVPS